jgi:hypothetical protein
MMLFFLLLGVTFHSGQRSCWLLAKTVHRAVSLRSAWVGLCFASSAFSIGLAVSFVAQKDAAVNEIHRIPIMK